jgi:hypothetical protein
LRKEKLNDAEQESSDNRSRPENNEKEVEEDK